MILALLLAAQAPNAEALALGRELAASGTLATLLPMIGAKERDDLAATQLSLSDAERETLKATADEVLKTESAKLFDAMGRAYAEKLGVDDLRALVAFNRTEAARHYRDAGPAVIAQTMQIMGEIDFKAKTLATFCARTGKGCVPKP